jgi:carbon storage regulator
MLVLSRQVGEDVMVGDCVVKVIEIRRDKVRLGFDFPEDVPIHRREIYELIKREGNFDEKTEE